MKDIVLLACGGRDYSDWVTVDRTLTRIHTQFGIAILLEGDATGADRLCGSWAVARGIHNAKVRALWDFYSRPAGHKRNAAMLLLRPDLVIPFPGGNGTANMVELARAAGIPIAEIAT